MKKKFSKILGVSVALALIFSLVGIPVAAQDCTDLDLDVSTVSPDGVNVVRGDHVVLTLDYDPVGNEVPLRMELEVCLQELYGGAPWALGQWDGTEPPPPVGHPYLCDGTNDVLDVDFNANSLDVTVDPFNGVHTWGADEIEFARQLGLILDECSYDPVKMEWTIVVDTTKKCEVGDNFLRAMGWWPGQEVWFDGWYKIGFQFWYDADGVSPWTEVNVACHCDEGVDCPGEGDCCYLFDNEEEITPELGLNAKGAQQKFWLNYIDVVDGVPLFGRPGSQIGWAWAFDPGVNLTTWGPPASPYDVKVIAGGRPYTDSGGVCHPAPQVDPPGDPVEDICLPDRYIEVQARATQLGDAEFEVWTALLNDPTEADPCCVSEAYEEVASAEKKWGELNFSKLDVHIDIDLDAEPTWSEVKAAIEADFGIGLPDPFVNWVEDEDHEVDVSAGNCTWEVDHWCCDEGEKVHEKIAEWVFCDFLELEEMHPAGGAVVHWWLAKDTEENQEWIQDLMDDIVARAGDQGFRGHDPDEVDSNEYWSATGSYTPSAFPKDVIMDWIDPPGTADDKFATNTDIVDFEPTGPDDCAGIPDDPYLCKDPDPAHTGPIPYINPPQWYGRSLTMDYHPGEIPGVSIADLVNYAAEDVLIITFVEYEQDYNGENLVLIEIGKKHFRKPPPPVQVKIPQVRWAGEKIVIEKDFGELGFDDAGDPRLVTFTVDQDSIGALAPVVGYGEGNYVETCVMEDGVARVIFESEYEGQAEVKCVLYDCACGMMTDLQGETRGIYQDCNVIDNHDFPIYYLKLESIEPLDPTPASLDPFEDGYFGVQVKGWFKTKSSELSSRPQKCVDTNPLQDALPNVTNGGDGIPDNDCDIILPAGRWVLPDDWPTLAGLYELRSWWDLMNNWEDQAIWSTVSPWGPFNSAVETTTFPGLAEAPTIGPFNTTQPVAMEDEVIKWVTTATVISDYWVASPWLVPPIVGAMLPFPLNALPANDWRFIDPDLRNTVVPDGKIEWFDCPMPPAKVIFQVAEDQLDTDLFPAGKWWLEPFSIFDWMSGDGVWFAPYYSEEIPSSWFIPVGSVPVGYNWDSWGMWTGSLLDDGPYDFWWDLGLTTTVPETDDEVLEVYSDNNGIAYVGLWALGEGGEVNIHAKADYPYMQGKHPPLVSKEVTQKWGFVELNPHFVANKTVVDVGETVTFTNLTVGGTHPYTKAQWDFDADGVAETVIEGVEPATMANVTWEYDAPGVYTVRLTMTDSTPTTRWEDRLDYITVSGEGEIPGDANGDGVVDALDITKVERIIAGLDAETPGADANEDGVVDALDITMVEMIIAGLA